MKINQLLARIDLLNIMSQHNCHNAVFGNVMQWAMYWNNNKTCFDKNDVYQFQSHNVLLNHLSKLYNMQHMKPTQKTIAISGVSNDTESVTVFDFKQQLLSLLRGKEVTNPSNYQIYQARHQISIMIIYLISTILIGILVNIIITMIF